MTTEERAAKWAEEAVFNLTIKEACRVAATDGYVAGWEASEKENEPHFHAGFPLSAPPGQLTYCTKSEFCDRCRWVRRKMTKRS